MMELETEDSVFTCTLEHSVARYSEGLVGVQLKAELHEHLYYWQELVQQY